MLSRRPSPPGVCFRAIDEIEGVLELFNRMLDVITGDADAALAMDWARIASAMEVNRGGSD